MTGDGDVLSGWTRAWGWLRLGVLAAGVVWLGHLAFVETAGLMRYQSPGIDFIPMWTAARQALAHPALIYDPIGLTRLQRPMLGHFHGLRPFIYPPTTLLALAPFAAAPIWSAYGLWTAGGLAAILAAMWGPPTPERGLVLAGMTLAPASVLVLATGQITFLIAALTLVALIWLPRRPWTAGLLFGLAAALKPQALVLLPLALGVRGEWRALVGAALAGAAAMALSIAIFGAGLWPGWIAALPKFERFVMAMPQLRVGMITPTLLGATLGLKGAALIAWRVGFAALGLGLAGWVFRASQDPARRLVALLGGALYVTPYAMHYDAALLAPAAALMLVGRTRSWPWLAALAGAAVLCLAAWPRWGAAAVTAYVLWAALLPGGTAVGAISEPSGSSSGRGVFARARRGVFAKLGRVSAGEKR